MLRFKYTEFFLEAACLQHARDYMIAEMGDNGKKKTTARGLPRGRLQCDLENSALDVMVELVSPLVTKHSCECQLNSRPFHGSGFLTSPQVLPLTRTVWGLGAFPRQSVQHRRRVHALWVSGHSLTFPPPERFAEKPALRRLSSAVLFGPFSLARKKKGVRK